MKVVLYILLFTVAATSQTIEATTADGRKVLLFGDKTWSFKDAGAVPAKTDSAAPPQSGDSVSTVRSALNKISDTLMKSEFETDNEYRVRLKLLLEKVDFEGKKLSDVVLIATPEPKYSAESKEFSLYPSRWRYQQQDQGEYQSLLEIKVDLLGSLNGAGEPAFSDILIVKLKMNAEDAKNAKPALRVAVYGYPWIQSLRPQALSIFVNRLVIFNSDTREVYLDVKATNWLTGDVPRPLLF